jgi:glycosyltransferase involved in cell wall biosynthesis
LIFVGRLDIYTKGLDILLEAFAEAVRTIRRPVSLTLVGPDWKGSIEILRQKIREMGLNGKVAFTAPVTGTQVREFLAQSDLYVHLSRHEGFPSSVSEALVLGKPSILSSAIGTVSYAEIASLPSVEVIPPDKHHAAKAMIEAIEDLPQLKVKSEQCLERVRMFFDWHEIAKRHVDLYRRFAS